MPSSAKERLQRRLAEKNKAAGILSEASASQTNNPEQLKCPAWDNSVPKAILDDAEKCHRSLVEELLPFHYDEFLNAPKWSLHRKLTAISLSPSRQFQRLWREMVEKYDLRLYFRLKERHIKAKVVSVLHNRPKCSPVEFARETMNLSVDEKMTVGDRLLADILVQLDALAWLCVGAVCRRWHFVGRCVWNLSSQLELIESEANEPRITSTESSLRLSKITYRFCLLSTLVLAGCICINADYLSFGRGIALFGLDALVFCGVCFVSSQMSISGVNDQIRKFVEQVDSLEELVLVNVDVCAVDNLRKRKEVRSLDFRWPLVQTANKKFPRTKLTCLHVSLSAFHRHNKSTFEKLCQEVETLNTEGLVFYGSALLSNVNCGLSASIFTLCLSDLMPHLCELSLWSVVFSDGTHLKSSSMDLLAEKIRQDSALQSFCLIEGEISESAIYNLQRCANLQIIILLRCEIISKDPDLSLLAGWHPTITHPGLLITDRQTIPRWIKPVYFPVFRIASFADLGTDKFAPIRGSYWTIETLLNASNLGVSDLSQNLSRECDAEDVLMDACWFNGACFSGKVLQNLSEAEVV